ncbi:MAG TPA: hypothetical protein VFB22_17380 [Candidatus Baltobacteraceae bacterium]|nr:hypothetical protein [Candidatus Baltobacteraceae bacterium]
MIRSLLVSAAVVAGILSLGIDLAQTAYSAVQTAHTVLVGAG